MAGKAAVCLQFYKQRVTRAGVFVAIENALGGLFSSTIEKSRWARLVASDEVFKQISGGGRVVVSLLVVLSARHAAPSPQF